MEYDGVVFQWTLAQIKTCKLLSTGNKFEVGCFSAVFPQPSSDDLLL